MPGPVSHSSWQYATKCVALLEMVMSIFQIAFSIFTFIHSFEDFEHSEVEDINTDNTTEYINPNSTNTYEGEKLATTLDSCWMLIYGVLCLVLAIVLYWGAVRRNLTKCRTWLVVSIILFVIQIADVISVILKYPSVTLVVDFTILFINGLCIWVVHTFMKEIKGAHRLPQPNPKPRA